VRFGEQIRSRGVEEEAGGEGQKNGEPFRRRQKCECQNRAADGGDGVEGEKNVIGGARFFSVRDEHHGVQAIAHIVRDDGQRDDGAYAPALSCPQRYRGDGKFVVSKTANMDLIKWREVTGLFAFLRGGNESLIFNR
jgi:hypothetical protein